MGLQLQLDFTHGTVVQQNIDLTPIGMSCVQCMFVDNSKNPNFLKFQVGGDIGYITVPALTQGYYPLIQFGPAFSFGAFTAGALVIPIVLFNIDATPVSWNPSSGGVAVIPGNGILTPAVGDYIVTGGVWQPLLTTSVTSGRFVIFNPPDNASQNVPAAEVLSIWPKKLNVLPNAGPTDATSWSVYVSNTAGGGSGAETLQASGIPIGTNWQLPNTGLVAGAAYAPAAGYGTLPPATNGALGSVVSGALGATTYYVKSTYTNNYGETATVTETNLAVAANSVLTVASPSAMFGDRAPGTIRLVAGATFDTGGGPVPLTTYYVRAPTAGHVFTAYTIENTNY